MFSTKYRQYVNPELLKYIKEQNDKWLNKYSNKSVINAYSGVKVSDLVKEKNKNNIYSSFFFTALISFMAGYKFRHLIERR